MKLEATIRWLARVLALLGGVVLVAITVMTCVSILGRAVVTLAHTRDPAFFDWLVAAAQSLVALGIAPVPGDFELVEAGTGFAVFAFLPWCQLNRGHATVDLFTSALSAGANRVIDESAARAIRPGFFEAIVAPGYTPEALEILRTKRGFEIIEIPPAKDEADELGIGKFDFKRIGGGVLVQTFDNLEEDRDKLQPVTQRRPTLEELTDLLFAWRAVRHVKSNAVVLAKKHAMVGMGAGQPSRVVSVEVALRKAGERAPLSVMASDAYFPFPDGIQIAAQAGVTAIIQPGGSIRDEMAIEVADRHHMAMVFTGRRHFKH